MSGKKARRTRNAHALRRNLEVVHSYQQRDIKHKTPYPSGDGYVLGDTLARLATVNRHGNCVLKKALTQTKWGYALPPRKSRKSSETSQ